MKILVGIVTPLHLMVELSSEWSRSGSDHAGPTYELVLDHFSPFAAGLFDLEVKVQINTK